MVQKGYFLIADITGYTAFMLQSELDHAQDILNSLFKTLIAHTTPPLTISNFQGDAILSYAPEGSFNRGQTLVEMTENMYCAFANHLTAMQINTTCTCKACKNIPNLDLKLFIHYGAYLLQELGGKQELSGPDVILVHRMMKNEVKEETGLKAYALITKAAAEAMELSELYTGEMPTYTTEYEHLGKVTTYVQDLKAVWQREREQNKAFVAPEESWVTMDVEVPVPPPLAWEFVTMPSYKRLWLDMNSVTRTDSMGGRVREGAGFHCAHDAGDIRYHVVDWRPFEYYTTDAIGLAGIHYLTTYRLEPTAKGTRVLIYYSHPSEEYSTIETINEMQGIYDQVMQACGVRLTELVDSELVAGNVVAVSAAAA